MPGWDKLARLIEEEQIQQIEEGADHSAVETAAAEARLRLQNGQSEVDVWAPFVDLPRRSDFAFIEPSDLASIRAARSGAAPVLRFNPDDATLFDKMHGAWLGRCVGCALGKPVEVYLGDRAGRYSGLKSWERQKRYLTAISPDEWPLRDYYPAHSPAEAETGKLVCPASTREHITHMETDDDIRYTVLGQIILQRGGRKFTSADVAATWFDLLGYGHVCTAETQAYRNMVIAGDGLRGFSSWDDPRRIDESTDWAWITHHLNPYREWIGAQIRVDSYGYGAAGNPELAAEFAWRDARISHTKNGIYGAMFCAAMIAAAFATDDPITIVRAGLAQIPSTSRLHHEIVDVISLCRKRDLRFDDFELVLDNVYSLLGHYHPVHTNNNAALCVVALLLSGGDFHRAITLAVMGGWDTDCNGATVGSIVGAICGASRTPTHWTGRLHDTLKSYVVGYHPIPISTCARRAADLWRQMEPSRHQRA